MSEFGGLWKHEEKTQYALYLLIRVGYRDSVAAGFPWGKRPEFPMGYIPVGTTKCTRYNVNKYSNGSALKWLFGFKRLWHLISWVSVLSGLIN